jgi:hypothetical protein
MQLSGITKSFEVLAGNEPSRFRPAARRNYALLDRLFPLFAITYKTVAKLGPWNLPSGSPGPSRSIPRGQQLAAAGTALHHIKLNLKSHSFAVERWSTSES